MLATLRRAGAPYRLSPTGLFSTLMVTSGTMTHRLKRLETSGFIQRVPNEQDARSMLVQLSHKGLALINRAVEVHVEHERQLLSAMPAGALADQDSHLSTLLQTLEGRSGCTPEDPNG
jgi:DNA-binding MarR family transcriptional regulator